MSDERWSRLGFREAPAEFTGPTQKARVWTESWVAEQLFCPGCGADRIERHKANNPAADFICGKCDEEFELKSQRTPFGKRVNDGALKTMLGRLESGRAPNLLLLNYRRDELAVANLIAIPKQFFTPTVIEARPPLKASARRAGWQGCNIRVDSIPEAGKVWLVRDGAMIAQRHVMDEWRRTLFLREAPSAARGWLIEVMKCVEDLGAAEFSLSEMYAFEGRLTALYPSNENVKPKIRQQLQVLRDRGFVEFLGGGRYRLKQIH